MKKLNRKAVSDIPVRPIKIVQFGEGNFLRGFVDWMVDILNEQTDFDGDIQIVQPLKEGMGDLINEQDGLYHVLLEGLEKGEKIQHARLITSVRGVLNPYEDYSAFLELAKNPNLQFIVSNTTEAGISFDKNDETVDAVHNSFPAKLTALLYHRYQHFNGSSSAGLSIIPCELIEKNGSKQKEHVLNYIALWSLPTGFKNWILENILFFNSLVDRIVPGFPRDSIDIVQKSLSFKDELVVKAEPFHLWVIEGPSAIQEKLPFSKTGLNVIFTDDLAPYRTRKVRILNGAHTAMVPIAYLHGFKEVREAVEDEKIGLFIKEVIFDEIIPTLDMPKTELESYAHEVLERFRNPFIKHKLMDISLNSISKFKVRVLPSMLNYMIKYENTPPKLAITLAYLFIFYRGEFESNNIELRDEAKVIEFFKNAWKEIDLERITAKILANKALWGVDLKNRTNLKEALTTELIHISKQ
ncbi:tagaturonate reductase [Flagellimonas sp. HMM57]|uniref:tagaturonate reductase n=1 Tax=unclassified Flagellimonas TaxID=2644544 RepID=UPI0013D67417|nr:MULTISPECIES: tagaturonate reductase [unclassified Flagellimonas]UII76507.1 tagaturonate reductase [Flagellimonas sp. HMM57]